MKILAFGSCLSRYVANRYANVFGSKIVASVYHNRSDQFCRYWIDGEPQPDWREILSAVKTDVESYGTQRDEDPVQIIANQSSAIGLHQIKEPTSLAAVFASGEVDLVIMDNHMDLGAKLWETRDGRPFFMRSDYVPSFKDSLKLGDYLTTEQSVTFNRRIAAYLQAMLPRARIVFVHFPIATGQTAPFRETLTREFAHGFSAPGVHCLAPHSVNKMFQTGSASHFKDEVYFLLAGQIHERLRSIGHFDDVSLKVDRLRTISELH